MHLSPGHWEAKEEVRPGRRAGSGAGFQRLGLAGEARARRLLTASPPCRWVGYSSRAAGTCACSSGRVPPLEQWGREPAAAAVRAPHPRPEVAQAACSSAAEGRRAPVAQARTGGSKGKKRRLRAGVRACGATLPQITLNKAWSRPPHLPCSSVSLHGGRARVGAEGRARGGCRGRF